MGKVVAFDRTATSTVLVGTRRATARTPRNFAVRLGWWALGAACAAPVAILAALRPFIIVLYWLGVIVGFSQSVLGGWLMVSHVRMDHVYQGAALFFGALMLLHGSEVLVGGLRFCKAYCDARRQI
ncbi:hypothetical protein [Xanthomonas albilineans]|uniref:Hypothetical membrane protein n=1 Tax=Xanthomonas albilineans (strain GPE PC73 / CFBP 7063) TaxID=380358 RepID=D6CKC2_XANAP|nr:hypothetical protein [Xanthomonas albilineans]CAZ15911.1 hypothetical membrane protein [Xanthomonas albilineans]